MENELLSLTKKGLYAMEELTAESKDAFMVVLLSGELIIDIENKKRMILKETNSHIYIPPKTIYKFRNNQMIRVDWFEIHRED
jgi:glyoxylate utilization-related uncharacterized protein